MSTVTRMYSMSVTWQHPDMQWLVFFETAPYTVYIDTTTSPTQLINTGILEQPFDTVGLNR